VPLLPRAAEWAKAGGATGASGRNWAACENGVTLPDDFPQWQRDLLTDPQTSGGLLAAVAPEAAEDILALAHREGFAGAQVIGRVQQGPAGVVIAPAAG